MKLMVMIAIGVLVAALTVKAAYPADDKITWEQVAKTWQTAATSFEASANRLLEQVHILTKTAESAQAATRECQAIAQQVIDQRDQLRAELERRRKK